MRAPRKFPMRGRQQGAALVIGLILLMVLTLLAISGMNSASLEFVMAGNEQYRANAFQAAEAGIEQSMVQGGFNPAGAVQPLAGATTANDSWSTTITPNPTPVMIPGSSGAVIAGYFFDIVSNGASVRGAQARNLQGVVVLSPASNTTTADPNLANPALVP